MKNKYSFAVETTTARAFMKLYRYEVMGKLFENSKGVTLTIYIRDHQNLLDKFNELYEINIDNCEPFLPIVDGKKLTAKELAVKDWEDICTKLNKRISDDKLSRRHVYDIVRNILFNKTFSVNFINPDLNIFNRGNNVK